MSKCVNKVTLVGFLGTDPELLYGEGGSVHGVIHLVTSEPWKDKKTGQIKENEDWHHVVLFKRFAETAKRCLKKGSKIYIEGKLKTHFHEKEGQRIKYTEVHASDFQMLDASPYKREPQSQHENSLEKMKEKQKKQENL